MSEIREGWQHDKMTYFINFESQPLNFKKILNFLNFTFFSHKDGAKNQSREISNIK
jgi:hypothetical protein